MLTFVDRNPTVHPDASRQFLSLIFHLVHLRGDGVVQPLPLGDLGDRLVVVIRLPHVILKPFLTQRVAQSLVHALLGQTAFLGLGY